ncbi:MAG: protein kinase [archaeon]|nr:protein kinase [archaeon]
MVTSGEASSDLLHFRFMHTVLAGDVEECRRLIDCSKGLVLDRSDIQGASALHLAASEGNMAVVRLLLEHGATATVMDRFGRTPLENARHFGHAEVAEELERAVAPVVAQTPMSSQEPHALQRRTLTERFPELLDAPSSLPLGELVLAEEIGRGATGELWRAHMRNDSLGVQLAVKVIRIPLLEEDREGNSQTLKEIEREIRALTLLRHPHILKLISSAVSPTKAVLVTSFIAGPTLQEHLAAFAATDPSDAAVLSQAVDLATDLASAVAYSHAMGIVHRDIKSPNIMLQDGRLVLIDFGASTRLAAASGREHMTQACGSHRWSAPELLRSQSYDQKVDIYSFAIVLWELLHPGHTPLAQYSPIEAAYAVAHTGVRPQMLLPVSRAMVRLISSCWHSRPSSRPSAAKLHRRLVTHHHKLKKLRRRDYSLVSVSRSSSHCSDLETVEFYGVTFQALSSIASVGSLVHNPTADCLDGEMYGATVVVHSDYESVSNSQHSQTMSEGLDF